MSISSLAKFTVALSDILCTAESIADVASSQGEENLLKKAHLVNTLAMLGFTMIETGAQYMGVRAQTMVKIKAFEMIPRNIQVPLSLINAVLGSQEQSSIRAALEILQKGVIAPFADVVRVAGELSAYEERSYLEMSPEEREKHRRPVYDYDPCTESLQIIGEKPIDVEECRVNLEMAQTIARGASFVRFGAEFTHAINVVQPVYQGIHEYLRRFQVKVRSLRELPEIPPPLREDRVLRQYICPISQEPIRHPVGDPNGRTVYEERSIRRWLEGHHTSPVTRLPLTYRDLVPMPSLQALIDSRLEQHDRHFQEYLLQTSEFNTRLAAPALENLQGAADEEVRP